MYGSGTTGGGTVLAATGLGTGSTILMVTAAILLVAGVIMIVRQGLTKSKP